MQDSEGIRYKIVAVPRGGTGIYRAWPDLVTYVRTFRSAARRDDYWRRFVVPKAGVASGARFQLAKLEERGARWRIVGEPLYAEVPVIATEEKDSNRHIIELGAA